MVDKEIIVTTTPYKKTTIIRDSEKYYKFLEERINSHEIGSKWLIPYISYMDHSVNVYWDIAEFEGYITIKYLYGDKARIEILKHYEDPFPEICSKYYN